MNWLVASEFEVPVVLVTGDDLTCDDALTYAPREPAGRGKGLY